MTIISTDIPDVKIVEPTVHADSRGYFFESFNAAAFEAATGICPQFVQDNESMSHRGVVRGLHFQLAPWAQSKIIRVVAGSVIDVAVDIRRGSPWFGRHVAVELSADNRRQMFLPRGFAHGFAVVSDTAVVQYKCDNLYAPQAEGGIAWDDAELGIDWGIGQAEAILSDRDRHRPTLRQSAELFDYNIDYYA